MLEIIKENNIIDFNKIKEKQREQDVNQLQLITIAELNDEIDSMLDNLEKKFDNKEDYIVKLYEIRNYLRKLVK